MSAVHFRQQAGASAGSALAGDVSGTLLASVVDKVGGQAPSTDGKSLISAADFAAMRTLLGALSTTGTAADSTKVANTTPGVGGLALLDDTTITAVLATLAATGVPGLLTTGKIAFPTIYVQQADVSESAGSLVASADLVAPIAAAATYVVMVVLLGTAAAATTGLQFTLVGPGNDVVEALCLHTPTGSTSETQVNGALSTIAASTGSPVGPAPLIDFGFAALTSHATAPSPATLTVQFRTEVAASAVSLKKGSMMLVWRVL